MVGGIVQLDILPRNGSQLVLEQYLEELESLISLGCIRAGCDRRLARGGGELDAIVIELKLLRRVGLVVGSLGNV